MSGGKIINLRQMRKEKVRADKARIANENAVKFGRTKAQKMLEERDKDRAKNHLNGHKTDG